MTYEEITNIEIKYPAATFEDFKKIASESVDVFLENKLIGGLSEGNFSMENYHKLLLTLFHQVYYSSSSFALAGTMVDSRNFKVRDYLMEHAEEEKEHWTWIINDLRETGYDGPDPRTMFPSKVTQAYISFAMFIAHKHPVSRLAMGFVLEDLSGKFGVKYGSMAAKILGLSKNQVSFTVQHGELDQGHSHDIIEVLGDADLTPYEWAHCCHTAKVTIALYNDMYDYAWDEVKQLIPA